MAFLTVAVGKSIAVYKFSLYMQNLATEAYSEPCQTSKIEHFTETVIKDGVLLRK